MVCKPPTLRRLALWDASVLELIIKRDGHVEPFTPYKLNQWGQWAAQTLGDAVDWPSAVLETVSSMSSTATSRELQQQLIRTCLDFDTWSYNRMAGRLYATLIRKDLYRNQRPTVLALHRKLQQLGFMEMLDYAESEYAVIQEWIDHERDFEYAHYQLHTHLTKYAIADRVQGVYYESPQFIYMRMAMALAVDQPRERRMQDVQRFYEHLSKNRINAPTPNHVNLGTPLRGYASCCLYTVADNARSIAVGNHIANTMTYMSAGIGAHMATRSVNDPVRGNNRLAGAPAHLIHAALTYQVTDAWMVQGSLRWSPTRTPVDNMNTLYSDPYVVVNLRTEYRVNPQVKLFAEITNLFNEVYASSTLIVDQARPDQAAFLPGDGRGFYAGVKASF